MAFKMNYSKEGFPYKSSFPTNNDDKPNPTVYATVDGVPLTYGEYQVYNDTGKMPSGSRSRRGKSDVDLSSIIEKEEARGIKRPPIVKDDPDELLPGDPGYVEK